MAEPVVLVCKRITEIGNPIKGSFPAPCTGCRELVWVSPSSGQALDRATILCFPCAVKVTARRARAGEPSRFGGFLPGQLEELRADAERNDD